MKKRILHKLHDRAGETLVEVMIALVIIALASMLLVVMVTTAGSMDRMARDRDDTFYSDLTQVETHDKSVEGAEKKTISLVDGLSASVWNIDVHTYSSNGLTSYKQ